MSKKVKTEVIRIRYEIDQKQIIEASKKVNQLNETLLSVRNILREIKYGTIDGSDIRVKLKK